MLLPPPAALSFFSNLMANQLQLAGLPRFPSYRLVPFDAPSDRKLDIAATTRGPKLCHWHSGLRGNLLDFAFDCLRAEVDILSCVHSGSI